MDYEADQARGADIDPSAGRSVDAAETSALFERTREHVLQPGRVPLATYRVQIHKGFDFAQATAIVPYLARLGVSHLYASPILQAMPGSNHGYDVIDPQRVSHDLGGEVGYGTLCNALATHRLRQVLDTVPNHMGIERGNALWEDVLENGPASAQAHVFDIEWEPVKAELRGKVLLPVLGDQYGMVLDHGELQIEYAQGSFSLRYFDRRFPINPRAYQDILEPGVERLVAQLGETHPDTTELQSILTGLRNLPTRRDTTPEKITERGREKEVLKRRLNALVSGSAAVGEHVRANVERLNGHPGDPRSFDPLDRLLDRYCPYRLAHWRVAGEEINYRRFFDINSLAAIRVEDEDVFEEAHRLIFQFLAAGQVQGLRIDHPDGLFDPSGYFLRVQERYFLDQARRLAGAAEDDVDWPERREALRRRWRHQIADTSSPLRKALYLVVEKIQGGKERIPDDWAVHGTTGYRFANLVTGVLVDGTAEREFTDIYSRFSGQTTDFATVLVEKKKQVMAVSMASEINGLARELNRISELNRRTRDFTLNSIRRALIGFIAHFPVYRTYVSGEPGVDERDAHYIQWTITRARSADPTTNASLFQWLQDVLLKRYPDHTSPDRAGGDVALRHEAAAAERAGDGEGAGGHGLLRLQPPHGAQRGGRGARAFRNRRGSVSPSKSGTGPRPAGLAAHHLHPRHQAEWRRPGAAGGVDRDARGLAAEPGCLEQAERAPQDPRLGRARSLGQRRVPLLPEPPGSLADGRSQPSGDGEFPHPAP